MVRHPRSVQRIKIAPVPHLPNRASHAAVGYTAGQCSTIVGNRRALLPLERDAVDEAFNRAICAVYPRRLALF